MQASPHHPLSPPLLPCCAVEFYKWYGDLTRAVGPLIAQGPASKAAAAMVAGPPGGPITSPSRRMNAFELLNCCSAMTMTGLFEAGEDAGARQVQVCGCGGRDSAPPVALVLCGQGAGSGVAVQGSRFEDVGTRVRAFVFPLEVQTGFFLHRACACRSSKARNTGRVMSQEGVCSVMQWDHRCPPPPKQ